MCGRFSVAVPREDLFDEFGIAEAPFDIRPRYNLAPSQIAPVLLRGDDGALRLAGFRWGLVPPWAPDLGVGSRMINARAETMADKPAFKDAFRRRRCLVPADGWFEWQGEGRRKTPMWIHLASRRPFAFAGLWERWRSGPGGEWLNTFAIVTTDAAPGVRHVHDRMPLLLPREARDRWLDPDAPPSELAALARPYPGDDLEVWPVSTLVNSPDNDVPDCIVRAEPPGAPAAPAAPVAEPAPAAAPSWVQPDLL